MPPERILVACPMKCGSTYVAQLLASYFGLVRCYPIEYWGRQEQNLTSTTMARLKSTTFVLQLHSRPYVPLIWCFFGGILLTRWFRSMTTFGTRIIGFRPAMFTIL